MSPAQIPDYLSISEPPFLSFAHNIRPRKLAQQPAPPTLEQELHAVEELARQLREQCRLEPQKHAEELLALQARVLRSFSLEQKALGAEDPKKLTNQFGYPRPSNQQSPPASATGKHYFVDEAQWQAILDHGQFDDIVCGGGFCALAYIDKALELDKHRKILVLERGGFWLPTHFQNLPLPFKLLLGSSETYPWSVTSKTFHSDDVRFLLGSCPFFGGRSLFWSAWSPQPCHCLMRNFPLSLIETAWGKNWKCNHGKNNDTACDEADGNNTEDNEFWKDCKNLLHVVKADKLGNSEYRNIQKYIDCELQTAIKDKSITGADYAEAAPLAVGRTTARSQQVFEKFSTPGPLLDIFERQRQLAKDGKGSPLTIATDVTIERFYIDTEDSYPQKRANILQTSRGTLYFPGKDKPNIILVTGAVPSCTTVLNSVPEQRGRAGSRLSGHFLTHIVSRFPVPEKLYNKLREHKTLRREGEPEHIENLEEEKLELELAASYLAGRDPTNNLQYHADITAVFSPRPETDAADAARLCPDYFSAPTSSQLKGSESSIVVACVMLGEVDETNPICKVGQDDENPDVTTNVKLHIDLSDKSKELRDTMYKATLEAIKAMAGDSKGDLEYWHGDPNDGKWTQDEPSETEFMMSGMCHEASTLYMSDDPKEFFPEPISPEQALERSWPSVDSTYKVYGTGNVYATGSAIFPTSGSWNPTLTNCGFAQDLARKLYESKKQKELQKRKELEKKESKPSV